MLWHADIKLPPNFALPQRVVSISWTRHADAARTNDKYGVIPKGERLDLSTFKVIEVETDGRIIKKVVIRGHLDNRHDVVFVLIPGKTWIVKTVWINEKNDRHKTLDRSRYVG